MTNPRTKISVVIVLTVLIFSCKAPNINEINSDGLRPKKILWAWERPEDLRFIDAEQFGVAFLAQTLELRNDDVNFRPRRQPLQVPANTYLIAVTRIETAKDKDRPKLSEVQKRRIADLIIDTLKLPDVAAIQIDFDVVQSERVFYRNLLLELKERLPANIPFTITSLASWCIGDTWFKDLPIDEAVPMAFEMGADDKAIRDFLGKGHDWNESLCRGSYGISINDPLLIDFKPNRTFFYFSNSSWKQSDVEKLIKCHE